MTRAITTPYAREQRVFFAALSLLLILFGTYIYLVSASIVHVIVRKEIDREIAHLNSRIGDLESAYIAAHERLTEEAVAAHGFVAISEKVYVEKAPTNLVLADYTR